MDYSTLTDEELAELYNQAPPGQEADAHRRELDRRVRFSQRLAFPFERVREAARAADAARKRIEERPFSEASNPWDFGLGYTGLGMLTSQRKPDDVRYSEHALAKFVDSLDGLEVPSLTPVTQDERDRLEMAQANLAPLVSLRDSWKADPSAMERLRSAYDDSGFLGNTSGLTKFSTWYQAPLSAAYNAIQLAAGVPQSEAEEAELARQAGFEGRTFLAGLNPSSERVSRAEPGEPRTRFDLMDQVRQEAYRQRSDWRNALTPERLHALREAEVYAGLGTSGPEFFHSMGVPETASVALGTALDVAADPSLGLYKVPGIMRKAARYAAPAAKAKRYGQAAWLGASDVAPPVFFNIGGRMVAPVGPLDPVSEQAGPVLRGLLPQ